MNNLIFSILKRKVQSGEINVEDIINIEYKTAIITWLEELNILK